MALASGTIFEIRASATTGNVNGAGFNTANANFPTDGTVDTNTGNTASPVFSSATYNFVAGDVGAWLYVKAGTNTIPGWYQIASVASNKATLTATIGAGVLQSSTNSQIFTASTAAGIATVGTPTGITFGIDYSQQDAAQITATDYGATGSSTTLTSAGAGFTRMMVGNFYHQTTTGTGGFGVVGWYEIVSYTNASNVVLDRTPNSGTASVACTGYIGGAGRLDGLEDAFLEMHPSASIIFIEKGTYTISSGASIASTNSTAILPSFILGYNTQRGDSCVGSNRPIIACGANSITLGQYQTPENIIFTGTSATIVTSGAGCQFTNCKFLNSSTTASRSAISVSNFSGMIIDCECVSQNGIGITNNSNQNLIYGNYIHDSVTGISGSSAAMLLVQNIIEACSTAAVTASSASGTHAMIGNTFYGVEGKIGIGINLSAANSASGRYVNNIIYGCTTGVAVATGAADSNFSAFNNFYNNTTDVSNFKKSATDLALDPQFTGATQITGTTATTSGSVLTQSGGDFSTVTDNVDYLRVTAGTGTTLGCYLITSHTSTTLTVNNSLGTGATADKVYYVTTGHNFAIGTNLKGLGFPSFTNIGSDTLGYSDVGAVQRQEASSEATYVINKNITQYIVQDGEI